MFRGISSEQEATLGNIIDRVGPAELLVAISVLCSDKAARAGVTRAGQWDAACKAIFKAAFTEQVSSVSPDW